MCDAITQRRKKPVLDTRCINCRKCEKLSYLRSSNRLELFRQAVDIDAYRRRRPVRGYRRLHAGVCASRCP